MYAPNTTLGKTMQADREKLTRDAILSKPGQLGAKIVYNQLVENDYKICLISDRTGGSLYYASLNDNDFATVGFTDKDIAIANCNRDHLRKALYLSFKDKIHIIESNLLHLTNMLNPINSKTLSTVIINPSFSNFFIPINLLAIKKLIEDKIIEYDPEIHSDYTTVELNYNKEEKRYIEVDEETKSFFGNLQA